MSSPLRFHLPLGTVLGLGKARIFPTGPAQVLLAVIAKGPDAVARR